MWDYFHYAVFISEKSSSRIMPVLAGGRKKSLNDRLSQGRVPAGGFTWFFHGPDCLQLNRSNFIFLWQEPLPQCQCDSRHLYQLWN